MTSTSPATPEGDKKLMGYDKAIAGIDYAMDWKNNKPDGILFATGLATARQYAIDANSHIASLEHRISALEAALNEAAIDFERMRMCPLSKESEFSAKTRTKINAALTPPPQ